MKISISVLFILIALEIILSSVALNRRTPKNQKSKNDPAKVASKPDKSGKAKLDGSSASNSKCNKLNDEKSCNGNKDCLYNFLNKQCIERANKSHKEVPKKSTQNVSKPEITLNIKDIQPKKDEKKKKNRVDHNIVIVHNPQL